jgi:hypothetical protein
METLTPAGWDDSAVVDTLTPDVAGFVLDNVAAGVLCKTGVLVPCAGVAAAAAVAVDEPAARISLAVFGDGGTAPVPGVPMPGNTVPCSRLPSFGRAADGFAFEAVVADWVLLD